MPNVTDNFNRANETPLSGGGVWTVDTIGSPVTNMDLSGNVAIPHDTGSDTEAWYTGVAWDPDQGSEAALTAVDTDAAGNGAGPGVILRKAAGATVKTMYRVAVQASSTGANNVNLAKFAAAVFTSLAFYTLTWVNGDVLTATVAGPTSAAVINLYQNGSLFGTFTDSSSTIPASGYPGISHSGSFNWTTSTVDNWHGFSPLVQRAADDLTGYPKPKLRKAVVPAL